MSDIIKAVAKEYGEDPEIVRAEMIKALKMAGLDVEPEAFIKIAAAMAKGGN